MNLRTIINIIGGIIILAGIFSTSLLGGKLKEAKGRIGILENNVAAFQSENDSLNTQGGIYRFTIEQLENSNDSVIQALLLIKDELRIKNRQLQQMTALYTELKSDTVFITIFEPIDTFNISHCNFTIKHFFNDLTSIDVGLNDGIFNASIDVSDNIFIYQYQTKEWQQSKFMKRLFTLNFKKNVIDKFEIKNDNDLNDFTMSKFIKIVE